MTDEYRPRSHDHLVEPFFGPFEGERAGPDPLPTRAGVRESEPASRAVRALVALAVLGILAGGIWLAATVGA